MAPRAQWKGYLKLSLVSCPIALFPATSVAERVSFRQVNRQTGNRLRQQLVDSVTGDVVDSADKARGYEFAKDEFILVEDGELEELQVESTRTIEIDRFVPRAQIDLRYLESPYYIVPDDKVGQEAFAVIREAMRGKEMVAIARVVLARRERPIMLESFGKGMRAMTLRYPYEVRGEEAYFDEIPDVKVPDEMLKLADHILDTKATDFDPTTFKDRYEEAVVEMLTRKQAGLPMRQEAAPSRSKNVVNLMDALRQSLAAEQDKPRASGSAERRKSATTQKPARNAARARKTG